MNRIDRRTYPKRRFRMRIHSFHFKVVCFAWDIQRMIEWTLDMDMHFYASISGQINWKCIFNDFAHSLCIRISMKNRMTARSCLDFFFTYELLRNMEYRGRCVNRQTKFFFIFSMVLMSSHGQNDKFVCVHCKHRRRHTAFVHSPMCGPFVIRIVLRWKYAQSVGNWKPNNISSNCFHLRNNADFQRPTIEPTTTTAQKQTSKIVRILCWCWVRVSFNKHNRIALHAIAKRHTFERSALPKQSIEHGRPNAKRHMGSNDFFFYSNIRSVVAAADGAAVAAVWWWRPRRRQINYLVWYEFLQFGHKVRHIGFDQLHYYVVLGTSTPFKQNYIKFTITQCCSTGPSQSLCHLVLTSLVFSNATWISVGGAVVVFSFLFSLHWRARTRCLARIVVVQEMAQ